MEVLCSSSPTLGRTQGNTWPGAIHSSGYQASYYSCTRTRTPASVLGWHHAGMGSVQVAYRP